MTEKRTNFAEIDLLVLDVDGVLTDGQITLSASGEEIKSFHAHDGAGMKYWRRAGKKLAIITGRSSPAVAHRAAEIGVDFLQMDAKEKLHAYEQALRRTACEAGRTSVVGDDLTDIPLLRRCGFPVAVADATEETKNAAAYVTQRPGGLGAVREVVELILKGAGLWESILSRYLDGDES